MTKSWGKSRRLEKLKRDNYYLILAMDHALSSGPIEGIDSVDNVNKWISFSEKNDIPAVVLNHRYTYNLAVFKKLNIIVQTMGLTKHKRNINKVALTNINEVSQVDGTAISVQINFEVDNLEEAIQEISKLVSEANKYQYPVLFMVGNSDWENAEAFNYAVRVCNELGADLIKIHLPSNPEELKKVNKVSVNEPKLLLAGGEDMTNFKERLIQAKEIGFQGVCIGRNIFQSPTPKETLTIINDVFKLHNI